MEGIVNWWIVSCQLYQRNFISLNAAVVGYRFPRHLTHSIHNIPSIFTHSLMGCIHKESESNKTRRGEKDEAEINKVDWSGIPPLQEGRQPITQQIKKKKSSPSFQFNPSFLSRSRRRKDWISLKSLPRHWRWLGAALRSSSSSPLHSFITFMNCRSRKKKWTSLSFSCFISIHSSALSLAVCFLFAEHCGCSRP